MSAQDLLEGGEMGSLTAPSPANCGSENTSEHGTECTCYRPYDCRQAVVLRAILQWEDVADDDSVEDHHASTSNALQTSTSDEDQNGMGESCQ